MIRPAAASTRSMTLHYITHAQVTKGTPLCAPAPMLLCTASGSAFVQGSMLRISSCTFDPSAPMCGILFGPLHTCMQRALNSALDAQMGARQVSGPMLAALRAT